MSCNKCENMEKQYVDVYFQNINVKMVMFSSHCACSTRVSYIPVSDLCTIDQMLEPGHMHATHNDIINTTVNLSM